MQAEMVSVMEISRLPEVPADRDRSKRWPADRERPAPPRKKVPREGAEPDAAADTSKRPEEPPHRVDIQA